MYQGYDDYLGAQSQFNENYFDEKYHTWHTSLNDSLASTLRLHGFTHEKMKDEQLRMREIESRMLTAEGRNALLQTSNEVAFFTSEQLRRLVSITMQHSQTHTLYLAHQRNQEALQHARKRQFFEQGALPETDNGMNF
jgi:P-type conjugative transfer protein TrbJ